jgi:uncharacterized protein (DUF2141 family)
MNRFARRLGAALIIVAALPGAVPVGQLDLDVESLRSSKGMLRICLTRDPANFPNCVDDNAAITRSIPASDPDLVFGAIPTGAYALAVIHDENGNAKLDTFAGIPREGVGFSRNPKLSFGPPRFSAARFDVQRDVVTQTVRMKYFL